MSLSKIVPKNLNSPLEYAKIPSPSFNFSHLSTFEEPGVAPHIHTFSCNSLSLSLVTVSASKSAKHVEIGYVFQ